MLYNYNIFQLSPTQFQLNSNSVQWGTSFPMVDFRLVSEPIPSPVIYKDGNPANISLGVQLMA